MLQSSTRRNVPDNGTTDACYGICGRITPPPDNATQELSRDVTSGISEVVYDTAAEQEFTVIIPKKIVLGSDKAASYDITVKGDVAQGSSVTVEPQDDVDSADGINFDMTVQSGKNGGTISASVAQADTEWDYAAITADSGNGTAKSGSINAPDLTFGIWSGNLTFLINFHDEYAEKQEEIKTGTAQELTEWDHTLDEENGIVTLNHYTGNSTDVTVYGTYDTGDKVYKTQIPNSIHTGPPVYTGSSNTIFDHCQTIQTITFAAGLDTSNVTDASGMFYACKNLTNIDFKGFNTSNIRNMSSMFYDCGFTSLSLDSFDTSNVTNMSYMFYGSDNLTSLDISSFDTHNVEHTNMTDMFSYCKKLQNVFVDQNNWDIPKEANVLMFRNSSISEVTYK